MAGALDQMTADHLRACACLHRFEYAGTLMCAPILLARDKARGHVDGSARECFEFGGERAGSAAAIPLQSALESGARIFGAVEGKLASGSHWLAAITSAEGISSATVSAMLLARSIT